MKTLLAIIFIGIICSGCATSTTILTGRQNGRFSIQPGLYPATRLDAGCLSYVPTAWKEESKLEVIVEVPFILIDFPFSLTFDTLLFPYDFLSTR